MDVIGHYGSHPAMAKSLPCGCVGGHCIGHGTLASTSRLVSQAEYDALLRERDELKKALETQPCIRPMRSQDDCEGFGYITVKGCIAAGNCGCDCKAALARGAP